MLDPIDGPAGDRNLIGRQEATQALADRLANGRGWLYGPSGIGKSALARTLAVGANRPWYSLDLRDLTGRAVATRLRAARQTLFATDVWGGLVVEDLNTIPGGSVKRELALLFEQARLRGRPRSGDGLCAPAAERDGGTGPKSGRRRGVAALHGGRNRGAGRQGGRRSGNFGLARSTCSAASAIPS